MSINTIKQKFETVNNELQIILIAYVIYEDLWVFVTNK